jgi:hypothetical protein
MKKILGAIAVCVLSVVTALAADIAPEVAADWRAQDGVDRGTTYAQAIAAMDAELGRAAAPLHASCVSLEKAAVTPADLRWKELYHEACVKRRALRLRILLQKWPEIVFTKHSDLGGSHYAYTEGQSDAQSERHFQPPASLCLLRMCNLFGQVETLQDDPTGVIRDPDVSYDGKRILFAWKKALNTDDYHLYEMDVATRQVRQLTGGLGVADYEGIYTPGGQIIFSSTRCVQIVDCWWTEVSNLYTCGGDGRYLRRLGFDQVHTTYPTVMPDGRIIYTRWDYNDRGQIFPQGLFQMNADGTGQAAVYGNNSWFPTTILHARGIPGMEKIVAIFTGHHTIQKGWLGIIDPSRGREENAGTQLIAPVRLTKAVNEDKYGQTGDQFQYPYPLSETEFLVTMKPNASEQPFAIYWIDKDGRRELLAADPRISCNQPVPLVARPVPHVYPSQVDYRQGGGVYYMKDVYRGPGLSGVPRGTIKKLRVVSFDFRAAGIGFNISHGPAGGALSSTPVSIGNGAWDPKIVLGQVTVHADGSAMFAVPARTPVYFQALDQRGFAVQTMRSWSTLQPGERQSCVGCHESKNTAPPEDARVSMAMRAGVERLRGFYGPPRGFSFAKEIQPILDRHCTVCHYVAVAGWEKSGMRQRLAADQRRDDRAFSLLGTEHIDREAKRKWSESYLALTGSLLDRPLGYPPRFTGHSDELVNWIGTQSIPSMLPPYFAGAAKSRLMIMLAEGHGKVRLSPEEMEKIACWIDLLVPYCGDYVEANAWSPAEADRYVHYLAKRKAMEQIEQQNIEAWIKAQATPP